MTSEDTRACVGSLIGAGERDGTQVVLRNGKLMRRTELRAE